MKGTTGLIIFTIFVAILGMKPSEAGVNDWHIQNIGEIKDLSFNKNKILFQSKLNMVGIIDKNSGKVENRIIAIENQRVISSELQSFILSTRYNQIINYVYRTNGYEKLVDNQFMGQSKKIQSATLAGKRQYFMTNSTLYSGRQLIKEAASGQTFISITGNKTDSKETLYILIQVSVSEMCIEKIQEAKTINRRCFSAKKQNLIQLSIAGRFVLACFQQATFIFSHSLDSQPLSFKKKLIEIVKNVLVFESYYFDLNRNLDILQRPVKSSRTQLDINLKQNEEFYFIYRDGIELFKLPLKKSEPQILRLWLNFRSQIDYQLVIQYKDLKLSFYLISKGFHTEIWSREQSMAYIEQVLFMKFSESDNLDNEYHRNLISHHYRNLTLTQKILGIPQDIIRRLIQEIADIKSLITNGLASIFQMMDHIQRDKLKKFEMSKEQEVKYGLRKYIVAITKCETILGIDTKNKQLLWKVNTHEQADRKLIGFVKLQRDYQTEVAVRVTYSSSSQMIFLDQILEGGIIHSLETYPSSSYPSVYKFNEHSITIKIENKVQHFSLIDQEEEDHLKEFYFYSLQGNKLNGWKVFGNDVIKIWNFETEGDEKILKIASAYRGDQRAHIPLFDKEKVFFKNVDFTNLAVLTSLNHTNIALYIINGCTGKIQFNQYKNGINAGLPINLVYDQNNVLVTYFNAKNKVYQIWTVEQYQERIEVSAINMITDYFKKTAYKPQQNRQNIIFESELYASPVTIKYMYVSESKMSLTRRNLFIITREHKIYTINRDFVSTRRPKKDVKSFFSNQKLPEHSYLIPFNPTFYVSYDLNLQRLAHMRFNPTDMESSIFLFSFGVDNFLIRTAPDKTFDMITDDFNHLILLLILVAATIAIFTFKRQITQARLKKPHLQ